MFLPNLSPACEIPDCSAFLANGLTTVLVNEDAAYRQLYHFLCAYTQIYPALGQKFLMNSYGFICIIIMLNKLSYWFQSSQNLTD